MPLAVLESDDASRAEYLKRLFSKVYLKDIKERNRLQNLEICERVLDGIVADYPTDWAFIWNFIHET